MSFLKKIMSKSRNLVKFLGVGHPAVKVVCEAARGGECDLEFLHPGWMMVGKPWMVSSQIVSKAFDQSWLMRWLSPWMEETVAVCRFFF